MRNGVIEMNHIIGIDLGFAATGIVIYDITADKLVKAVTVRTQKDNTRKGLRTADDDMRRCIEMVAPIRRCLEEFPGLVAVELPSGGTQSSRAARAMGMATGMLGGILGCIDRPVEYYTPGECKKVMTGDRNASKAKVEGAVVDRFGSAVFGKTKTMREHQVDAAAAVVAAMEYGQIYRVLRGSRHP